MAGAALLLCCPATLQAAEWSFDPVVSAAFGYSTNAALTTEPHDSVSSMSFTPVANIRRKTGTSEMNVELLANVVNYLSTDIEDIDNEQASLKSFIQTTERMRFGLDGIARLDTLFESAVTGSGTGNVQDVDIGLATTKVRRNWYELQPSVVYATTERSSVAFSYRLTDVKFEDVGGTSLVDYQQHFLSGVYSYQLTDVNDLQVVVQGSQFRPSSGIESDNVGLLGGVSHKFSPTLSSSILAGVGKTTETLTDGSKADSNTFLLQAQATQQSELSSLDALISRDVQPSGIGRSTYTDQLRVYWDRKLANHRAFVFQSTVFRNKTLEGSDPLVDRFYAEAAALIRWRLAPEWFGNAGYRYRYQKYDASPDSAESNGVFLALVWATQRRY